MLAHVYACGCIYYEKENSKQRHFYRVQKSIMSLLIFFRWEWTGDVYSITSLFLSPSLLSVFAHVESRLRNNNKSKDIIQ